MMGVEVEVVAFLERQLKSSVKKGQRGERTLENKIPNRFGQSGVISSQVDCKDVAVAFEVELDVELVIAPSVKLRNCRYLRDNWC